jgi:DNA-binding transcriptional ArsR family regulator
VSSRLHDPPAAPPIAEVEGVFLALSHEARRHVILLLSQLGGELPSGYLAARFQHSWPTTTRHLKVLEEAGLVEVRREGRGSHYRLNRDRLRRVVGGWLRHVDPVGPERKWTSSGPKSTGALAAAAEGKTTHTNRSRKQQRTGLKGERR